MIDPPLWDVDLRPYVFVTRDKRTSLGGFVTNSHLEQLVDVLMGSQMAVSGAAQEVEKLTGPEKWVHFFGPVNVKTKVDSFIGYAAHLGLIRGGTPSGLYC